MICHCKHQTVRTTSLRVPTSHTGTHTHTHTRVRTHTYTHARAHTRTHAHAHTLASAHGVLHLVLMSLHQSHILMLHLGAGWVLVCTREWAGAVVREGEREVRVCGAVTHDTRWSTHLLAPSSRDAGRSSPAQAEASDCWQTNGPISAGEEEVLIC